MAEPVITTVAQVLEVVSGLRLVAGARGLGRAVRSVNVMEVPDIAPWVRPGDFLMTVLYSLRDDTAAQEALVPLLHQRGAAALAVKPGRYVDAISSGMRAAADRLGLPLLEMAPHLSFSDLAMPIAAAVMNRQAALAAWEQRVQRELLQAALEGWGVQRMVAAVAALVGNPVALADERGQLLAMAGAAGEEPLLAAVVSRPPSLWKSGGGRRSPWREVVEVAGRPVGRVVAPVTAGESAMGYLCMWERGSPAREPQLTALAIASVVAALELRYRRSVWQVEWRYRGEFLRDLMLDSPIPEVELAQRALQFGCDLNRPHVAVVLVPGPSPAASGPDGPASANGGRHLDGPGAGADGADGIGVELQELVPAGLVGSLSGETVALVPDDGRREELRAVVEQLRARAGGAGRAVAAGVGSRAHGVAGLRRSYQEARRAAQLGWRMWQRPGVYVYDEMGVYQLLAWLDPAAPPPRLVEKARLLAEYDRARRTDLLATLETYFACMGSVKRVSEKMHTHYNTILYRLRRIGELTGCDLDDPAQWLELRIALLAYRYFQLPGQEDGLRLSSVSKDSCGAAAV